jgi:L-histidine Nalpha-methyltransferase
VSTTRVELAGAASLRAAFAADVAEYLLRTPRQLPSKYFYDPLGSALFEAICRLPWYRITRAESALLRRHARDILGSLPRPVSVAELGCGSGEKLAILIEHADERCHTVELVDISAAALEMARTRLEAIGVDSIVAHQSTYDEGVVRLSERRGVESMLVLFLGSNIGNFDPPAGHDLLVRIRASLREGDALLVGTDLVKPEPALIAAYDDPLQVTAAFNRNLLRRINDELGGTFDLARFAHRAVWNAAASRVEMHLVSSGAQLVTVPAAGLVVPFTADEPIWTESSYKFEPDAVVEDGLAAGFSSAEQWIDDEARFALTRFTV